MIRLFLSFDFYGAGNIGDDLMLGGFLNEMKSEEAEFYCSIPRDEKSQKLRFPEIKFISGEDRNKTAIHCDHWIGVGDTPVQVKSGNWFLDHLLRDSELRKKNKKEYYFIGVGAESESVTEKEKYKAVLNEIDHIWTRDKATTEILTSLLGVSSENVTTSSDLANISLNNIFSPEERTRKKKYDTGVCYYDENAEKHNLDALKIFLKNLRRKNKKVFMFGNEVRSRGGYEFNLYMSMFNRLERAIGGIKYFQPDYQNAENISALVSHYRDCEVIMSSRYHSLLTAAWAGCRIVALERSSKVSALAESLGIEEVKKPFKAENLMTAYTESKTADKNILEGFYKNAVDSMVSLKNSLNKN